MATMLYRLASVLRLGPLIVTGGCVSLHTPLTADEGYPVRWGSIVPLGQECKSMSGAYDNAGTLAITGKITKPILLTSLLGLSEPATRLSMSVVTRKLDKKGDAFSTLEILAGDDTTVRYELNECFCVKQTLMCKVAESSRAVPYVSIGGSQRNVYFSLAQDGALIAKLQDYHVDIVFVVPVFGKSEPWARFVRSGR